MGTAPQTPKRNRAPGAFLSVISLGIVALMLAALNPSQPPPPPTAEYAPEAVQRLKDAPRNQTSLSGQGEGEGDGSAANPSPTPSARGGGSTNRPIDSKRVRRCVGSPPRQTEDPQSPPCVAYFEGDNGGSTWAGVTVNEIRVAVPSEYKEEMIGYFAAYFNQRYELYGRQLVFVPAGCSGSSPNDLKNCAVKNAKRNVFASLSVGDVGGNEYIYYDELARQKVLSVNTRPESRTEAHFAEFAPYEWGYLTSFDKMGRHMAELICKQLAGKNASHAGGALQSRTRVFGLVSNVYPNAPAPDLSAFIGGLKACGVTLKRHAEVQYEQEGAGYQQASETSAQQAANAMVQMSTDGVTSVVCLCHSTTTKQLAPAADGQGYQPEWLINTFQYNDENLFGSSLPQNQWTHAFGLTFWNKAVAPQEQPWYEAIRQQNPDYDYEKNPFVYFGARYLYHQMLVLVSGIQMAGPKLTPQTFQDGLWGARFPNPDHPTFPGKVGFNDRDHTMIDDASIIWWNPSGRDPWLGGQGAFCPVRRGQRMQLGSYPSTDETFRLPCQG